MNERERRWIKVLVMSLGLISIGVNAAGAQEIDEREFLASDDAFRVIFEQEGQILDPETGSIALKRAPFILICLLKPDVGVLANFSYDDAMFIGFQEGKSLDEILEEPDSFMGMAEYRFNPEEKILIDPVLPHFLYINGDDDHRFSEVMLGDSYALGRRVIAYFTYRDYHDLRASIDQLESDRIYASFLHMEYGPDWERVEIQREAFQLIFGE